MHSLVKLGSAFAPPLIVLCVVLVCWESATILFKTPMYLLPGPRTVLEAALVFRGQLFSATMLTAGAAACGFLLSLAVGTLIGFVFAQSRMIRLSCYPYAVFLQTVPMIAVAPLIVIWCGYGFQSVVAVSFVISLFPVLANATTGLLSVEPELIEMFRLFEATRWQVLIKLRLPNAVPYLIAGAKTSAGLAVIGAIVGEFFAGYGTERFGLGYLVLQAKDQLKTPELFAAVIAATLLGVLVFMLVSGVGGFILQRWYGDQTL
ncbi:MAG: ABC transporter permease [Planctomycetaceae bacterium]